ncbi:unnamed protein product, partial [Rotaria sp. Silwood1]
MAVGIVKHNQSATATASGIGNPVFIVGSSTGKDGIHGATFASEEISEESESKRPNVQVGDPFTEKLLLEATLELIQSGAVAGIQDMGAAGITCSTSEMSAKGNCGMKINLDLVPLRDSDMSGYEIMLSESQERMLVVVHKGQEEAAKKIFDKWDLNCVEIGEIIKEPNVKIYYKGKLEADVPAEPLVLGGGAPVYKRETKEPTYFKETQNFNFNALPEPKDYNEVLLRLVSSPNITNKNWVYTQYDTQVRTNTMLLPGGDASVIRIKETKKALAMKVDCNGRYVYLNPYKGGMSAVCESARNVACTGATPLAITNCLNFGNPYNPEIYYQFTEAIRGMGDACKLLETPVTGGNVSFYNQSKDYAVFPTPSIGMIGLLEDYEKMVTSNFKDEGDIIILLGNNSNKGVDGSEYLNTIFNLIKGDAPCINLDEEKKLIDTLLEAADKKLLKSAHDISDGGLAVALAECWCYKGYNCSRGTESVGIAANSAVVLASLLNSLDKDIAINIEHVKKAFGKNEVLKDINLRIKDGESVCTLGKSGTGKSVILQCIAGLLRPDSGKILIYGEDVPKLDEDELQEIRKKIGFLFQSGALYDSMSVRQNLEFPLRRLTDLTTPEINDKVKEALEQVGLAKSIDKMPSELSG